MKQIIPVFIITLIFTHALSEPFKKGDLIMRADGFYYLKSNDLPFTGIISGPYIETINQYSKQIHVKYYTEGKVINGKREGIWLTYSDQGNLLFKTHYKKGSHNGVWESYHENGNIKLKGNYKVSKLIGIWQSFSENGVLIDEVEFK